VRYCQPVQPRLHRAVVSSTCNDVKLAAAAAAAAVQMRYPEMYARVAGQPVQPRLMALSSPAPAVMSKPRAAAAQQEYIEGQKKFRGQKKGKRSVEGMCQL
jgi:hypothetical protein